jgi:hypothetical protein
MSLEIVRLPENVIHTFRISSWFGHRKQNKKLKLQLELYLVVLVARHLGVFLAHLGHELRQVRLVRFRDCFGLYK